MAVTYTKIGLALAIRDALVAAGTPIAPGTDERRAACLIESIDVVKRDGWRHEMWDQLATGIAGEDDDPSGYGSSDYGHLIDDCALVDEYWMTGTIDDGEGDQEEFFENDPDESYTV